MPAPFTTLLSNQRVHCNNGPHVQFNCSPSRLETLLNKAHQAAVDQSNTDTNKQVRFQRNTRILQGATIGSILLLIIVPFILSGGFVDLLIGLLSCLIVPLFIVAAFMTVVEVFQRFSSTLIENRPACAEQFELGQTFFDYFKPVIDPRDKIEGHLDLRGVNTVDRKVSDTLTVYEWLRLNIPLNKGDRVTISFKEEFDTDEKVGIVSRLIFSFQFARPPAGGIAAHLETLQQGGELGPFPSTITADFTVRSAQVTPNELALELGVLQNINPIDVNTLLKFIYPLNR